MGYQRGAESIPLVPYFFIWLTDLRPRRCSYLCCVCGGPPDLILDGLPLMGGQGARSACHLESSGGTKDWGKEDGGVHGETHFIASGILTPLSLPHTHAASCTATAISQCHSCVSLLLPVSLRICHLQTLRLKNTTGDSNHSLIHEMWTKFDRKTNQSINPCDKFALELSRGKLSRTVTVN